jgi:8-oxo-dGTP diphosphatase
MIDVTCAIIEHHHRILITQRGPSMNLPGKWEFPGGKVEAGESHKACIIREIKEELDIEILVKTSLSPHEYQGKIRLIPFICEWVNGQISLSEHAAYQWIEPDELSNQDWAEADIAIVETYLKVRH